MSENLLILLVAICFIHLVFMIKLLKENNFINRVNAEFHKVYNPGYKLILLTHSLLYKLTDDELKIKKHDTILKKVSLLTGFNRSLSGYNKVLSDKLLMILEKNDYQLKTNIIGYNADNKLAVIEIFWLNPNNIEGKDLELVYRETYFITNDKSLNKTSKS